MHIAGRRNRVTSFLDIRTMPSSSGVLLEGKPKGLDTVISFLKVFGSSGFLVGKHRPVPGHDAQACRSEKAHSFIAERFSERPGAVKAALGAAKRSLDGEGRSGTIPREGMARWTVVFAPISFAHYKPGIPKCF